MNLYQAIITESLSEKSQLSLSVAFVEGTIFYPVLGGVKYKIIKHLKVNGDGTHKYKIKRCDTAITEFDLDILVKNQKIFTEKTSLSYLPNYAV